MTETAQNDPEDRADKADFAGLAKGNSYAGPPSPHRGEPFHQAEFAWWSCTDTDRRGVVAYRKPFLDPASREPVSRFPTSFRSRV